MTALDNAYDCECCQLPLCRQKLPGIGYYCGRCELHLFWHEELGRHNARFADFEPLRQAIDAEHTRMAGLLATIRAV